MSFDSWVAFTLACIVLTLIPGPSVLLVVSQATILITTSTIVVAILLAGFALIAARARATLQNRSAQRKIGYASGSFLIGGSVLLATTR